MTFQSNASSTTPGRWHIVKAISALWGGALGGAGFAFLTTALLARELSSAEFGRFSTAIALGALLAPLASFGVPQLLLQAFGRGRAAGASCLASSLQLARAATACASLALMVWALLGPHDLRSTWFLLLMVPVIAGQARLDVLNSTLQIEGKFGQLALAQLMLHLGRFLTVGTAAFFGVFYPFSGLAAVGIYAVVGLVVTMVTLRRVHSFARKHLLESSISQTDSDLLSAGVGAWPFAVAAFLNLVYYQSNIVLLGYLDGDSSAGIYSLAFQVMALTYLLPTAIFQKYLLPKIHSWIYVGSERLYLIFRIGGAGMLLLGGGVGLIVWALAPYVVPLVFGEQYGATVAPLRILALCAPFMFMAIGMGSLLATAKSMKLKIGLMSVVATFNVVMNVTLITYFGVTGAAVATVMSNALLAALYYVAVRRVVFTRAREHA